jgi:hypothetical protein
MSMFSISDTVRLRATLETIQPCQFLLTKIAHTNGGHAGIHVCSLIKLPLLSSAMNSTSAGRKQSHTSIAVNYYPNIPCRLFVRMRTGGGVLKPMRTGGDVG